MPFKQLRKVMKRFRSKAVQEGQDSKNGCDKLAAMPVNVAEVNVP